MTPGWGHFWPQRQNLNKLGRGPLDDANRDLANSKFGLFYSNFLILTPTFSKVPIEKYGKTSIFSDKQHFYSYFHNPSENSVAATYQ